MSTIQQAILGALCEHPDGLTAIEIIACTRLNGLTVRAYLTDLQQDGVIERCGIRMKKRDQSFPTPIYRRLPAQSLRSEDQEKSE